MSTAIDLRVMQLLFSRLCHELVGPVGAINNGMELVKEFGAGMDDDAADLIASSAKTLAGRLQFYRVAYGLAAGAARTPDVARDLVKGVIEPHRIKLDWGVGSDMQHRELSDNSIKLLLNMCLMGAETVVREGQLSISIVPSDTKAEAQVTVTGQGIRIEEDTMAAISGTIGLNDLTPRAAHGYFTKFLAQSLGTDLEINQGSGQISLVADLLAA